jgi:hypothetical protein
MKCVCDCALGRPLRALRPAALLADSSTDRIVPSPPNSADAWDLIFIGLFQSKVSNEANS